MRLPPPLIAAVASLALALAAAIPLAVNGPSPVQAQVPNPQLVVMDEWSINPQQMVVKANQPVRFVVTNAGVEEHRFVIDGMGMDQLRTDRIAPGATITLDAVFTTPGTYQTWCSVNGGTHKAAGMVATLRVVPETEDAVITVPVQAGEFFFNPKTVATVAGQPTRFQLEDVGEISHVFMIVGHGVEMRSPTVRPGQPIIWDVTLDEPGTYEVYCSFNVNGVLHRDMGMLGTLEVLRGGTS